MKRTTMTCLVGMGLILAGAAQTSLHERTRGKQLPLAKSLKSRGPRVKYQDPYPVKR